jgi:ubiquinone/menaquinone biosynthesis C-methylase UbiE
MKTQLDWPIAFFDDDYLRIYRPMLNEERTRAEVGFIEASLALPPGAAVLDLACGIGRHAVAMALRGYRVTGVDFNSNYLEIAAADAERAGTRVTWITGDMRELAFEREFDAVYSYFTSFGYFSDVENEQVLARIARALRPGGRFLIDMANRDWILTHPQQRTWTQREDGALLMEESALDLRSSRVIQRQTLIEPQGGARVTKEFNLRVYTCAELGALLERHGLEVLNVWGGPDGREYSTESRRLILLAAARRGSSPA